MAGRRDDPRPHAGPRRRRLQVGEVEDELVLVVVDEHEVRVRALGGRSSTSIWICGAAGSAAPSGCRPWVRYTLAPCRAGSSAVDLGARRIGVAVTDGLGLTAQPLATIARHGGQRDLDAMARSFASTTPSGWCWACRCRPRASGGAPPESAEAFADRLARRAGRPGRAHRRELHTVEAEEVLLAADLSRARREK